MELLFPLSKHAQLVAYAPKNALRIDSKIYIHAGCSYIFPYKYKLVRACIHETKFNGNKKATALLADALTQYLLELHKKEYILIPMPLSSARYRERGYNQILSVATRALENMKHVHIRDDILIRNKNTRPQTELKKEQREGNVAGAFVIRDSAFAASFLNDTHIILLDDVITTGATMRAAKATLSPHSTNPIICLALAH